jgi:hypothetical protein
MPHRPSPPAVRSVTWPLTGPTAQVRDAGAILRQGLLLVNVTGFLAGYFVMYNQWMQLAWFGLLLAAWLGVGGFSDFTEGLRRDRWLTALGGLAFLMLVRSSVLESPGMSMGSLWLGWCSTFLMLAVLLMVWPA